MSKTCPNLSDFNVSIEFNELVETIGESFAYFIWNKNQGVPLDKSVYKKDKKEVIGDSKLFSELEKIYGSRKKAILARALTFVSSFSEKYPKFEKLNITQKVNAIQTFLSENSKHSLEDIIKKQNAQRQAFLEAERVRAQAELNITRESYRKIGESADQVQKRLKTDARDRFEAYVWFRTQGIDQFVSFTNMFNVANLTAPAFAQWTRDAITLFKGSDFTDLYHESWHEFVERYLTPSQKLAMYSSFKERPGGVLINETYIPNHELTNRQIDEILAEEFRAFVLEEKRAAREFTPSKNVDKTKGIFSKVWSALKYLFNSQDLDEDEPFSPEASEMFKNLLTGKFDEYEAKEENVLNDILYRSSDFDITLSNAGGTSDTLKFNALYGKEILSAIDFYFAEELDRRQQSFEFLVDIDNKDKTIKEIYDVVREKIDAIILREEQLENSIKADTSLDAKTKEDLLEFYKVKLDYLSWAYEGWDQVVEKHKEMSKGGTFKSSSPIYDSDEIKDNVSEEDQVRDTAVYGDRSEVNPLDLADPEILELIRSIPELSREKDDDGNYLPYLSPKLGLPQSGNFHRNKNMIQNKLNGLKSYEEVINKLQELALVAPQVNYLIQRLPKPGLMTANQLSFKNKFMQFVSMPYIPAVRIKSEVVSGGKKGSANTLNTNAFFADNSSESKVLEFFDEEFQTKERKFQIDPVDSTGFITFSLTDALNTYPENSLVKDKDFYNFFRDAFGVDLIQQGTPYELVFDTSGNINIARSSKLHSLGRVKAVKLGTLHARKKMELFRLISSSTNSGLKRFIVSDIISPMSWFLSDIPKKLNEEILKLPNTDPIKVKYAEMFGKSYTINNERKQLFGYIESFYNLVNSMSHLNDEDHLEWGVKEWNHMSDVITDINSVNNRNELTGNLAPGNLFLKHSIMFKSLFDSEGSRKSRSDGSSVRLELFNFTGFTVGQKGRKTTNLTGDDKMIQDFLGWYKGNYVENVRIGAKSSSYGVRLNQGANYFPLNTFIPHEASETEEKVVFASDFITQMEKYLEYEVERMFNDRNRSNPKEERGAELIIFRDILEEYSDVVDQIKEVVSQTTPETLKKDLNALLGRRGVGPRVQEAIKEYFGKRADAYRNSLVEVLANGDSSKLLEKFGQLYPSSRKYTADDLDAIIKSFIANYYVHQVEIINIVYGDISNFAVKSKDFDSNNFLEVFKRLGAAVSPGKQPHIDDSDLLSRNSIPGLARKLELENNGSSRDYDKNFNYVQYQDVNSFNPLFDKTKPKEEQTKEAQLQTELQAIYKEIQLESYASSLASQEGKELTSKNRKEYLERAEKEIGKNLEDLFESNDKESDAQAVANLDFYRYYSDLIGEWKGEQEKAYKVEVEIFKLIKQYRSATGANREALKDQIEVLREEASINPLPSLKLGFWGSPTTDPKYVALGKYSVAPILPSVVFGTDLEDQMFDMLNNNVDFATFDSGSKMSIPVDSIPLYKQEGDTLRINNISKENIVNFPIKGLRRQQYIAPKFKNQATLSTQLVKLIFSNFYTDGAINPEFASIGDIINTLQQDFINSANLIVVNEKAKLFNKLEAKFSNGNLVSFNKKKFRDWIFSEFDRKGVASNIYDYFKLDEVSNEFLLPIEGSPQRALIESVIASAISKRILKPKLMGEAYVQVASTGHSKMGTRQFLKPSVAQLKKYGINGLRDYRVENGKTQPADIKIAFQAKKHKSLLKLDWNGAPIGDLRRLNEALLDDEWVEQHTDKLRIVGVRIPVQGFNSMEYFRVREFLPENAGGIIIVPLGITTKSGSDFDIDKLFMYESTLDPETGQLIESDLAEQAFSQGGLNDQLVSLASRLNEWKDLKKRSAEVYHYKELGKEAKLVKQAINEIDFLLREEYLEDYKDNLNQLQIRLNILSGQIKASLYDKVKGEYVPTRLKYLLDTITRLEDFTKQLKENKLKGVATNKLIDTMSKVLSRPELYSAFTKKNDSTILKNLSREYEDLMTGGNQVTSSSIFDPLTSIRVFVQNTIGKKSLGVDAKVNALHKLFQQTGLKFQDPRLNDAYILPSNKDGDGRIILGGHMDAKSRHLISDIINEFINGHVDIEKEDWINYFNADKVRTPIILQMILNGTPIETALMIVNQPVVQYFVRETQRGQIKRVLNKNKSPEQVYEDILVAASKILKFELIRSKEGILLLEPTFSAIARDSYFKKHIQGIAEKETISGHEYSVYTKTDRQGLKYIMQEASAGNEQYKNSLAAQIAFLSQYYVTASQNKAVREFTSAVDFNTSSYRTINDFYKVYKSIGDARQIFNQDAIEKILDNSVVSPFNIVTTSLQLYEKTFDFIGSPLFQTAVNNFVEEKGEYWSDDERATEVNRFTNNFILYILQNYEPKLFEDYRDLNWFNTKYPGNLKSVYTELSKSKDPNLKKFFNSNQVLNNTKFVDVKGMPDHIYPALATAEKDADTTSAFNFAFKEGLSYNKSDAELSKKVRNYFEVLGMTVLMSQGYNIKFKSIQPILPIESLPLRDLREHLDDFKSRPNAEELLRLFTKAHTTVNSLKATPEQRYFPNFKTGAITFQEDSDFVPDSEDDDVSTEEPTTDAQELGTDQMPVISRESLPLKKTNVTNTSLVPLGKTQKFTRQSVQADPDYMYLFTDNAKRTSGSLLVPDESRYSAIYGQGKKYPSSTQAVIRGLDNAFPITTMVDDKRTQWTDDRFEEFKEVIDSEIEIIKNNMTQFKGIKFSAEMPFGKGSISNMKNTAPKIWNYLNSKLAELGIDNAGETPTILRTLSSPKETVSIKGKEYTKDEARLLTAQDLLSMGLTPEEMNELFKQLC